MHLRLFGHWRASPKSEWETKYYGIIDQPGAKLGRRWSVFFPPKVGQEKVS